MFIAALFIIPNTWKQHKCPSTDEWIKMMWYIMCVCAHTHVLSRFSHIRLFATLWTVAHQAPLKGKRKNDMVRPSFGEQGPHFIFQSSFYTLSYA